MGLIAEEESEIWNQIDTSESYMVCCMFEEAASLAASIVKQLRTCNLIEVTDGAELGEMMEAAGMVYIQSLKESGRTRELFGELKELFGSVIAIPAQVVITGSCLQISEGYFSNLRPIFEEYLEKWVYLKEEADGFPKPEHHSSFEGCFWQSALPVEKYLELADIYAVTILGMILGRPDLAISWIERHGLPEEKAQDMLRRIHSLLLSAHSSPSGAGTISTAEKSNGLPISGTGSDANGDELKLSTSKSSQASAGHISDRMAQSKFGNFQLALPRRKIIFLSSLMLFIFYILRKRRGVLMRFMARQITLVRKALLDAWQLAFSVQVNPLAAVQQLPAAAPRGGNS